MEEQNTDSNLHVSVQKVHTLNFEMYTPVILSLCSLKQEDSKFEASLVYMENKKRKRNKTISYSRRQHASLKSVGEAQVDDYVLCKKLASVLFHTHMYIIFTLHRMIYNLRDSSF